jgi:hypothetical protein
MDSGPGACEAPTLSAALALALAGEGARRGPIAA